MQYACGWHGLHLHIAVVVECKNGVILKKSKRLKDRYSVTSIDKYLTKEWYLKKHYLKRLPNTVYDFGLFDENKHLVGVCSYGNAPSSFWNNGGTLFNGKHDILTIELNRLVLNEHNEKNLTSFFVSRTISLLPECVIISYADIDNHHHGYIYQATNFLYTGIAEPGYKQDWELFGKKHTGRWMVNVKKILGDKYDPEISFHQNIINNGGKIPEKKGKHRYIYIKSKRRKRLITDMIYDVEDYPKGDNINYDSSYRPLTQTRLF